MHLEADPHPHPHPHPGARRGILPWLLISTIVAVAVFLALRGDGADDESVAARFHEGVGLLEQYNYTEAYDRFAKVVRARPRWDAAQANAGLAALNLQGEHLKAAEDHFREALRLNPGNLHARYGLGVLLKHLNRMDEAFEAFEAVAKADPGDAHALYEYGAALAEKQKYPEAKEALVAALRIQPAYSSALYRLSRVELMLKNREAFEEALRVFRALDERKEGITSGNIYGEGGKYYTAIRDPVPPKAPSRDPSKETAKVVSPEPEASSAGKEGPLRPDGSRAPVAIALGDIDGDGLVDAVVTAGQAGKDADPAGVKVEVLGQGMAVGMGDLDGDGDLDRVAAGEGEVRLEENDGKGRFSLSTAKLPPLPRGFPVEVLLLDADSDWDLDILVALQVKEGEKVETALALLNNNRDGTFEDIATRTGIEKQPLAAREVLFADLDSDIDVDLLLLSAKDEEALVLLNDRAFRYRKVLARDLGGVEALLSRAGLLPGVKERLRWSLSRDDLAGSAVFHADGSGRPFLITSSPFTASPLGPAPASWIAIDLAGPRNPITGTTWTNVGGIGATVEVRAGDRVEVRQVNGAGVGAACGPHRLYFDLGDARRADYVRILWPDGVLQVEMGLAANKVHRIEEVQRKPTSCPIVFAWDGTRFRYVADFLGVGGLGYLESPGFYGTPDPTEVLELPDLAPAADPGGRPEYRIRIVEPLEECTYLDSVELVAADAPDGWTLHPDEVFAVRAPRPGAGLLAFRQALLPDRATDHRGRDVTAELRRIDRVYPESWSRDPRFPGAAEPHSVVLEWGGGLPAGGSPPALRPVLFLHGYVEYGYSTSNFAAAQARVALHAPTVAVERGGRWEPLRVEWGFPGGTPRWMTVDLGGLLAPGDRRLRVHTDMEIYWDQAFLAEAASIPLGDAGEPGAGSARARLAPLPGGETREEARVTALAPDTALLRHLGFPRDRSPDGRHPRLYDYEDVAPTWVMKPFPGRYTRHGEVADLLLESDDRLATFGEGDEVALTFRADRLPRLPEGWKRTFFLSAVGYCKDMDLYTAASDSVEPLPYRAMKAYPPPPGEGPHLDPARAAEREARDDRRVAPLSLGAR